MYVVKEGLFKIKKNGKEKTDLYSNFLTKQWNPTYMWEILTVRDGYMILLNKWSRQLSEEKGKGWIFSILTQPKKKSPFFQKRAISGAKKREISGVKPKKGDF